MDKGDLMKLLKDDIAEDEDNDDEEYQPPSDEELVINNNNNILSLFVLSYQCTSRMVTIIVLL